jgi:site-specific DNA-methyltransferase (adenine-specific)
MSRARGAVRDSIIGFLTAIDREASLDEINDAVKLSLGKVSPSSVRSYLNLNVPTVFKRTSRGKYALRQASGGKVHKVRLGPPIRSGKATLFHADCFDWLASAESNSVHAVVTDPPYGVLEYTEKELAKLRGGRGGVWRIPPSFDGHQRGPLPRFTVLDEKDRAELYSFFRRLGQLTARVIVPGGNIVVASNPLLSHLVAGALVETGLELRGYLARLTMTMRGGDRPKNAHEEFNGVSVMPRSQWEPWVVLRKPLDGRVQDNLRRWKTGGFRRPSSERPFGDVIKSSPTTKSERTIAPHPSLKPQHFLRQLVRASLPLGEGIVLDPFAGSGSTLAAANAVGYQSIGLEADPKFVRIAEAAIPKLSSLRLVDPVGPEF